jgi:UDP-2,3-diacylglucosamine hydrolase
MLSRPLQERRALALAARDESGRHMAALAPEIMDVNDAAVREAFRDHGVRRMIHGHTHRPATHTLDEAGLTRTRIVLGDWYRRGSVLRVSATSARLDVL